MVSIFNWSIITTAGFFFTISSKFVQLRMLPEMFRALVERPETLEDTQGTWPFQALRFMLARELVLVILLVLRLRLF